MTTNYPPKRFSWSLLAWATVGAVGVAALFAPRFTTGDDLGLRRFLTPEISSEWVIAQRFTMDAANLHALEIRAVAVGAPEGSFRLTLVDATDGSVEGTKEVSASELVRDETHVFRFDPIEDSAYRAFQFDIAPSPDAPGRGVALRATKGPRLEEGGLLINGKTRWASLAFQTHAPSASAFRRLIAARDPERPPRWLALVGLFGAWVALRFVLRAVLALDDRSRVEPAAF